MWSSRVVMDLGGEDEESMQLGAFLVDDDDAHATALRFILGDFARTPVWLDFLDPPKTRACSQRTHIVSEWIVKKKLVDDF